MHGTGGAAKAVDGVAVCCMFCFARDLRRLTTRLHLLPNPRYPVYPSTRVPGYPSTQYAWRALHHDIQ
eukprot:879906-Rhodomonas_salina.1